MTPLYQITGWDEHYEKSQNKRVKTHHWVAMPIKHDGGGFRRITIQPNSSELFAAWCLIVQVGAKCKTRGVLSDLDGVPLDAEDLAIKTGFPVSIFESAFEFFTGPKIKWLEIALAPSESENTPSKPEKKLTEIPTVQDSTLQTLQTEEEDYPSCLKKLKEDQTFDNAIETIYASHPAFAKVNRMHLEVSLNGQSDRLKWIEAIEGMTASYAGADMPRPNNTLKNWLAGKVTQSQGGGKIYD